jgi:muramoyltetrapeptide carboxypeptidase
MVESPPRRPRAPARPATVGIFAPSGRVDAERLREGIGRLERAGHRVLVAPETSLEWRYFAGTDSERLAAFDRMLDDPAIDLVLAARGGYGFTRLIARIDWARVAASAKAFVGFSDFTVFNCAALARANLATLHGPMLSADIGDGEPDEFMWRHFGETLWGVEDAVTVPFDHGSAACSIEGTLWGGNLANLAHLAGTPYLPEVDGGLLYVEDIGEEPYAVERMFLQLFHAGVLQRQRAILLGEFTDCVPAGKSRYPYCMAEVVETLRGLLACPLLEQLPFGHVARKLTLPFGLPGTLSLEPGAYTLSWAGLARA